MRTPFSRSAAVAAWKALMSDGHVCSTISATRRDSASPRARAAPQSHSANRVSALRVAASTLNPTATSGASVRAASRTAAMHSRSMRALSRLRRM
jgi:hypothetical protein